MCGLRKFGILDFSNVQVDLNHHQKNVKNNETKETPWRAGFLLKPRK